MTTLKRILALMMAGALALALCAPAFAEARPVYVVKEGAKVYSASGAVLTTLSRGARLTLTGAKGSVCQVAAGSQTGYMKKSDLTARQPAAAADADSGADAGRSVTVYAARDGAKLYNASGVVIGSVALNTKLTCTGVKGSVCRVTSDGRTAYMKKADLASSPVVIPEVTPTPAPAQPEAAAAPMSATVYAARDGAKVYSQSGAVIRALAANTPLTLTGVKGSVCRVTAGGSTGYMRKSDLSETQVAVSAATPAPTQAPEAISETAWVSKNGAKVYSASGRALGALALNTAVTVTAVKNGVCRVTAGGKTGFMRQSDLSTSRTEVLPEATPAPQAVNQTAYVCKDTAKVYDASLKAIAELGKGTAVIVVAVKGKVCQVSANGRTGYMNAADLSCDKADAESAVVDIPDTIGYVNKAGAKVYDASGNVIATLDENTAVTVSAYNDQLVQVVNGSTTGYMSKADIAGSPVSTAEIPAYYTLKSGDSGEAVKKVQQRLRELGYFAGVIGGNYQSLTKAAVEAFQGQAKLSATGVCDAKTLELLFSDSAPKMPQTAELAAETSVGGTSSKSTTTPARGAAKEMDWWTSGIQKIFARGTTATITDVSTGLAWREQRRGGTNHADVQPLTAADTAVLKKVYGGKWSWNRRAIFVTINGVNYAASMNGMPHGGGSISGNNFNGHHCIHFTNSRTHGSNKVCSLHQAAIKKALAVTL